MCNGCEHVQQRCALLRLQTTAVSSRRVDVSEQARRVGWALGNMPLGGDGREVLQHTRDDR
eukprot:scaffold138878_cov75-Phaeocystis_antarctica.AAC.1